jgi:hypothetical protein
MQSIHNVILSLLMIILSCTLGCGAGDRPGPVAVVGINTIEDLIASKCKAGFAVVVLPGQSPLIQQGTTMPGEILPIQGTSARDKVFANDKYISCDEKRKIRFISLTYDISAVRVYPPPRKEEPLPLFEGGELIIKGISITDVSPTVTVEATALDGSSSARLKLILGTHGIVMRDTARKITATGLFPTTPRLKADRYATRLKEVEAVDDNAPPGRKDERLRFFILGGDNYDIQVSSN